MIKRENKVNCESLFKNDVLYDTSRHRHFKLRLFGLKIWEDEEGYTCDIKNEDKQKRTGF